MSAHAAADEDRTRVEDIELAGELVPPVHIHHVLGVAARQIDLDETVEDKKEVDPSIAALEKHGAARQLLHHTEGNEPLDLIRAQLWERFGVPRVRGGRIQRLAGRKPARLRLGAHEGQHIHVTCRFAHTQSHRQLRTCFQARMSRRVAHPGDRCAPRGIAHRVPRNVHPVHESSATGLTVPEPI